MLNFCLFSVSSFSHESKNPRDIGVTIKFQGSFGENLFPPKKSPPDPLENIVWDDYNLLGIMQKSCDCTCRLILVQSCIRVYV